MYPKIKLVILVSLFMLLGLSTAFGQGAWEFDCFGNNFFSWQSQLSDSAGNPLPAGNYVLVYCYYEDSAATILIGCCTDTITIAAAKSLASSAAVSSKVVSTSFAYPVPILEDVVKRRGIAALTFPEIWLELTLNGETLEPTFKIYSVPFAGVAQRLNGDIVTRPGRIIVSTPAPSDSARIVLSADSTGASIKLYNAAGDLKVSLTSDDSTVTFFVPVIINGDLTVSGKATIGPGHVNSGNNSFVVGQNNTVSGPTSSVVGGNSNTASGLSSHVCGGDQNTASGQHATVIGGFQNQATGFWSVVLGGTENSASGPKSLAAGRRAKAMHTGSFVWADNTNADFASTAADQFLIRASGGVGVGTNAPAASLHIKTPSDKALALRLERGTNPGNDNIFDAVITSDPFATGNILSGGSMTFRLLNPDGQSGDMAFAPDQNSLAMVLKNDGRVGIGTTIPTADLHVEDDVNAEVNIKVSNPNVGLSSSTALRLETPTGTSGFLQMSQDGILTLGNSHPGGIIFLNTKTQVNGNVLPNISNTHDLGSSSLLWQDVWATNGTIQTSDARLKKNIKKTEYGLKEILQLRPVSYVWKEGTDESTHLGLIAQDVQEVVSEVVVVGDDEESTLGLRYQELVPVLINAIKELNNEKDQLAAQLTEQQQTHATEIESLKAKLSQLTRLVEVALASNDQSGASRSEELASSN